VKYMLLFCDQPSGGIGHIPPDERAEYAALRNEAAANGAWVLGAALVSDEPGTRVRHVDGEVTFVDGPFAEITDLLSGMFVMNFDSHDDALAFAARIPAARNGAIEVRRVVDDEPV
jgi:hypothetical protein